VKISNETKVGIMAIITIALSVWGYQFLRGRNIIKASNNYYVRYDDIGQLAATSPVLIHGLKVGTVSDVALDENMRSIIATLTLDKGMRIPATTQAVIISTGIMGGKAIDLQFAEACTGDDCAKPNSFLQGRVRGLFDSFIDTSEGGTLDKIKSNIGEILNTLGDSLTSPNSDNEIAKTYTELSSLIKNLASITNTLDNSMGTYDKHLRGSLANVEVLTGALAKNQDKIAQSITHLESISKELDDAHIGQNASALMADAKVTFKTLNTTMAEAEQTFAQLSSLTTELQSGKGSLGKLMKDPTLYDNLSRTTKSLDLLLQDLRLNPKRYVNVSVFGKKQKEYTVPEDDPAFQE
jgi:phospholipid/cholesterol/gamma-HCH transport system substrate-binding protein